MRAKMNQKHKQAFQELRGWCEKWDTSIDGRAEFSFGSNLIPESIAFYYTEDFDGRACAVFDNYTEERFNFMEQEDDNTEE